MKENLTIFCTELCKNRRQYQHTYSNNVKQYGNNMKYSETERNNETQSITKTKKRYSNLNTNVHQNTEIN